jgi:hypothetical protein
MAWEGWENYEPGSMPRRETEPAKPTKYRSVKTVVDSITFDSKLEARRWQELRLMEKAGMIRGMRTQVAFPLVVNKIEVCRYVADFVYDERVDGKWRQVVEDTKSPSSREIRVYRVKAKLMAACLGIIIREVYAQPRSRKRP